MGTTSNAGPYRLLDTDPFIGLLWSGSPNSDMIELTPKLASLLTSSILVSWGDKSSASPRVKGGLSHLCNERPIAIDSYGRQTPHTGVTGGITAIWGTIMTPIRNHNALKDPVPSLSIKNVPDETLRRLRARAERNHRSLKQELLAIVEAAAYGESEFKVDDLVKHVRELRLSTPDEATRWIREDRDSH